MSQWKRISHDLLRFGVKVEFAKEVTVELSVRMGVAGWGCPSACNILLMSMATLQLKKSPAVSASAAEETTCLSKWHSICTGPLLDGLGLCFGL